MKRLDWCLDDMALSSQLFDIKDNPFGLTYPEWIKRWYEWWCSTPQEPKTGQEVDGVFFLTTKRMERHDNEILETYNTLSTDKAILFPVDKWFSLGFPFTPDQQLRDIAKQRIDMLPNISVRLDNQTLTPTRIQSPVFTLHLKRDMPNPELGKKIFKGKYKCVVEGYWIFLKPNTLQNGTHKIPGFASCKTGVLSLDVRHTLNVI